MLFASTRSTLSRELGSEKFASTVFATEEEEIVSPDAWRERDGENSPGRREELMGDKERELEAVRRAEAEARNGTPQRDIGIGGTFGPGSGSGMRVSMPVDEAAKTALKELQDGGLVQLVRLIFLYWFMLGRSAIGSSGGCENRVLYYCMIFKADIRFGRQLISPPRQSRSLTTSPVSRQVLLPPTSPPPRPGTLSTTIPVPMSWSSCTLALPVRRSRSGCCTPARGGMRSRSPRERGSRSRKR